MRFKILNKVWFAYLMVGVWFTVMAFCVALVELMIDL